MVGVVCCSGCCCVLCVAVLVDAIAQLQQPIRKVCAAVAFHVLLSYLSQLAAILALTVSEA